MTGDRHRDAVPASRKIRLVLDLRRKGVTDTRVLAAIERIPREKFVPDTFRDRAYEDTTLPIGHHQTISMPSVVARMSEALQVGERMKVLEVGTGSGYQAAVLATLCRRLYTIERHPPLAERAQGLLDALKITNVTTRIGDGMLGWPQQAPFDRIMVTAAADGRIPQNLVDQLGDGGLLVAPLEDAEGHQRLVRLRRDGHVLRREDLGPVRFVPLLPGVAGR